MWLRSGYCLRFALFILAERSPATRYIYSHCEFIKSCLSLRSDFLCFRCAHAHHTYCLRLVCALPTFIWTAPDASQCTGERKRTRRAQKQNIQLIWNCVDKSFTLVPEQRTFSIGAERKFKFPNASMSPLSTILRFRSRTTPYSVCYSSGHGSISVRDISFFWLPAFGKRHTSKKVSHSFTRAQQCTHIIMFDRFILVLTFRVRCRRVFSLRSFHVHLNALEIRMHLFSFSFLQIMSRMCNDAVDLFYWNGMRAAGTPSKALHFTITRLR